MDGAAADAVRGLLTNNRRALTLRTAATLAEGSLQSLAAALCRNTSLISLDLYGAIADGDSAGLEALAAALCHHGRLTYLDLGANMVAASCPALSQLLTSLPLDEVRLARCGVDAAACAALFSDDARPAEGLDSERHPSAGPGSQARLARRGSIRIPAVLTPAPEASRLRFGALALSFNPLGAAGGEALAAALPRAGSLHTLQLEGCELGDSGTIPLAQALGAGLMRSLRLLDLTKNNIGDGGASALARGCRPSRLSELLLGSNAIRDEGGAALARALAPRCCALRTLILRSNRALGDGTAVALAAALTTNTRLTTLDLCGTRMTREGALAIGDALVTNGSLRTLRIEAPRVDAACRHALAALLAHNAARPAASRTLVVPSEAAESLVSLRVLRAYSGARQPRAAPGGEFGSGAAAAMPWLHPLAWVEGPLAQDLREKAGALHEVRARLAARSTDVEQLRRRVAALELVASAAAAGTSIEVLGPGRAGR